MQPIELQPGDVMQLSPECRNPMFAGCMMTVSDPKSWGAQGYIQMTGRGGKPGGAAFYRAMWDEMESVGKAAWVLGYPSEETEDIT